MLEVQTRTETPATATEVLELVADAAASGRRLEIVGGGTKRGVGHVEAPDAVVALRRLREVVDYAPEELVLTAQPGARIADLEKLVAAQGQILPFEPPRLTRLLKAKGEPTLGGVLAANLSGPRRIRAGAARDHILGFAAVTGRGEQVKAGGKVVKNVTGYDLSKLMAGSWGTLAVLTEVTIKVLPAPRTEVTLLLFGLDAQAANLAMTRAMTSAAEVSGAAHLPAAVAARPPLKAQMSVTAFRIEGFEASVRARADTLCAALEAKGLEQLDPAHSREFWAQVREVEALWNDPRQLWRVSAPPASGWQVGKAVDGEVLYDWAGGLVWALCDDGPAVRHAARALGGHATLYRGDSGLSAFTPLEGPLAALTARVKAAFDPNGVLNPGRMAAF